MGDCEFTITLPANIKDNVIKKIIADIENNRFPGAVGDFNLLSKEAQDFYLEISNRNVEDFEKKIASYYNPENKKLNFDFKTDLDCQKEIKKWIPFYNRPMTCSIITHDQKLWTCRYPTFAYCHITLTEIKDSNEENPMIKLTISDGCRTHLNLSYQTSMVQYLKLLLPDRAESIKVWWINNNL